jgi:hypothetical protein
VPVGSTIIPVAMPRAPFTCPSAVQMFVRRMAGMSGVYKKRPGKGILVPSSDCWSKFSADMRKRLVDLIRVCAGLGRRIFSEIGSGRSVPSARD